MHDLMKLWESKNPSTLIKTILSKHGINYTMTEEEVKKIIEKTVKAPTTSRNSSLTINLNDNYEIEATCEVIIRKTFHPSRYIEDIYINESRIEELNGCETRDEVECIAEYILDDICRDIDEIAYEDDGESIPNDFEITDESTIDNAQWSSEMLTDLVETIIEELELELEED